MNRVEITKKMIEESTLKDAIYTINEVLENTDDNTYISLETGVYDLTTAFAKKEYCYITCNDASLKSLGFFVKHKKNIVIDGNGSLLNGIGRILPFYLTESENITVKKFEIDYERAFTTQGEILESTPSTVILKIDKEEYPYTIHNGVMEFIGRDFKSNYVHGMLEFYKKEKRPVSNAIDNTVRGALCGKEIDDGIVEIYYNFVKQPEVGNVLTIKHDYRYVPAITINKCDTVLLENIWIKQAGTMGVVAQLSKDITVDHVDTYPDPNSERVFSINADSTHFANCSGTVIVQNGRYESMFDDVINVHGNYMLVKDVIDESHIIVETAHEMQLGFCNLLEGCNILICDRPTMMETGKSAVKSIQAINDKFYKVELEQGFSFEVGKEYCIDNIDAYPNVIFRNNICGKNRARGLILTSTKKMIVENNNMDCEGSVIKVNSDMKSWHESAAIDTLIIRNNKFERKNHNNWGTALIDIDPGMLKQIPGTYYHGKMIVENNEITIGESPLFFGYSFESVKIKCNNIYLTKRLSAEQKENLIQATNYGNVEFEDNEFIEN